MAAQIILEDESSRDDVLALLAEAGYPVKNHANNDDAIVVTGPTSGIDDLLAQNGIDYEWEGRVAELSSEDDDEDLDDDEEDEDDDD